MKKYINLAFAGCLAVASLAATAQTCGSPGAFNTPGSGPTAGGTTCGGSDSIALICDVLDSAGKNDAVYSVTIGASGVTATQIALSGVTGAGFNAIVALFTGTCSAGSGCVASGDAGSPMSLSGVAAGTYFMTVSAASADASGACGTYVLTANGTLPVSLQSFSVE